MDRNELESKVLDMLEDICADDAVREERDVDLFDAGLLDSLAAIEVLVGIEENFGVEIAPTAVERKEMNTVNKIIDQIAGRSARRSRALRGCLHASAHGFTRTRRAPRSPGWPPSRSAPACSPGSLSHRRMAPLPHRSLWRISFPCCAASIPWTGIRSASRCSV